MQIICESDRQNFLLLWKGTRCEILASMLSYKFGGGEDVVGLVT